MTLVVASRNPTRLRTNQPVRGHFRPSGQDLENRLGFMIQALGLNKFKQMASLSRMGPERYR